VNWAGVDIEPAARAKAGWLDQDLAALGLDPAARRRIPKCAQLPGIVDLPEAMGVYYVLEGASLGGQIISRRLRADLAISEDNGGRFFASYGDGVGVMWRAYVSALERLGATGPTASRIEFAALETFACFEAWLSADELAETASDWVARGG
jgi:heme oxygenase